jgi:uncharacterized membrane protein
MRNMTGLILNIIYLIGIILATPFVVFWSVNNIFNSDIHYTFKSVISFWILFILYILITLSVFNASFQEIVKKVRNGEIQ